MPVLIFLATLGGIVAAAVHNVPALGMFAVVLLSFIAYQIDRIGSR